LVEVMISVAVTIIIALGTLGYQYYSVRHDRSAQAQFTATRIGQLILEDWKSTGGDPAYDPTSLGLGFLSPSPGESGTCVLTLDNQTFYVELIRSDIEQDTVAGITLCQIRVTVRWRKNYGPGALSAADPTVTLTTYVRRDGT
jgi:Tfp pilus assembly protein PilV